MTRREPTWQKGEGWPAGLAVADAFGLRPFAPAFADGRAALLGNPWTPPNRWGLSSIRTFKPEISIPTWLGYRRRDRRLPIYHFFNRVPAPRNEGYSTRVTYARDFRGGRYTYDGHLGTDFAAPVGTPIVAAAPGLVLRVAIDIDKGGRKVVIDHGHGLFTTSNHLSRALVAPGDRVARGQVVGLSGASGMEFVLVFPWVSPHLHFNVWLNGVPVDPFAIESVGEVALWRTGNEPVPEARPGTDLSFEPTPWDRAGVDAAIEACRDPALRERMRSIADLPRRAAEVLIQRNYRAATFTAFPALHPNEHPRQPRLDLPFRPEDTIGITYPGFRA